MDPVTRKNARNPLPKRRDAYRYMVGFHSLRIWCIFATLEWLSWGLFMVKTCSLVASNEARTECSPVADVGSLMHGKIYLEIVLNCKTTVRA